MSKLEEIKNKYVTEFNPYSMSTVTDMRWLIEKLEKAIEILDETFNGESSQIEVRNKYTERAREFLKEFE